MVIFIDNSLFVFPIWYSRRTAEKNKYSYMSNNNFGCQRKLFLSHNTVRVELDNFMILSIECARSICNTAGPIASKRKKEKQLSCDITLP